jgi:transposase
MDKRDARSLTPQTQEEIRRQAIRLVKSGMKAKDVADQLEVSRKSVQEWKKIYKEGGMKALKARKQGRPMGSGLKLSEEQQAKIKVIICDATPEQLKMPFALWTREAVESLIMDLFKIKMERRQVGRYLKRWGFTPQRPVKRAYERNDKAVRKWMDEEYPAIAKKAAAEDAEVHWGDETGIKSNDHRGRGFAPKGKTPVLRHKGKAESVNMISTVTNLGKLRFMIYEGSFNAQVFIRFLTRLIKSSSKKVHLIVDNLRVHHAKLVKAWVEKRSDKIELHYLPSYSPDLNPDEYLNCDLKTELAKRPERRIKGKFTKTVRSTMKKLQGLPKRIASYFEAKPLAYTKSPIRCAG